MDNRAEEVKSSIILKRMLKAYICRCSSRLRNCIVGDRVRANSPMLNVCLLSHLRSDYARPQRLIQCPRDRLCCLIRLNVVLFCVARYSFLIAMVRGVLQGLKEPDKYLSRRNTLMRDTASALQMRARAPSGKKPFEEFAKRYPHSPPRQFRGSTTPWTEERFGHMFNAPPSGSVGTTMSNHTQ